MAQRTITVYVSGGKVNYKLPFEGATWGELQSVLKQHGIDSKGMNVMDDQKHTYQVPTAQIREDDFTLFFFPMDTKSGVCSSPRECVAEIINLHGDSAKAFFNAGKNYTNKKGDELYSLLKEWNKRYRGKAVSLPELAVAKASTTKVAAPKTPNKADIAKKIGQAVANKTRQSEGKKAAPITDCDRVDQIQQILCAMDGDYDTDDINLHLERLADEACDSKPSNSVSDRQLEKQADAMFDELRNAGVRVKRY